MSGEKFLSKDYIPWNLTQKAFFGKELLPYLVSTKNIIFNIHLGKPFHHTANL